MKILGIDKASLGPPLNGFYVRNEGFTRLFWRKNRNFGKDFSAEYGIIIKRFKIILRR